MAITSFYNNYYYYLSFFLILFGVKCEQISNYPEEELSPISTSIFSRQKIVKTNIFWEDKNLTKETPLQTIRNQYLKGYSLKIPKMKLLKHGALNMSQEIRIKRGVPELYNMISCTTGCNPISYKGYGCFCGLFGAGYPVDGIDRCCKMHDWCYDAAKCPMYVEYFVPYYWKCWDNKPFCALDHGDLGPPGSCADKLCECDRALSECLKRYPCPSRRAFCKTSPYRFIQNALMLFT